jgi:hypothetical protein
MDDSTPKTRWPPAVCLIGMAVGVVLAAIGASWSSLMAPDAFWSEDQAREYQAAADAIHASSQRHDDGATANQTGREAPSDERAAMRERFNRIQAELERAQFARFGAGPWLTRIGLAAAVAFGIGYLACRGDH